MQLPLDVNLIQHLLNSSTVSGDLNDITTTGFYYVQDAVNAPTSAWPHVFVNANDNKTKVVQLALPDKGTEGLYYRTYADSAWSNWQHVGEPAGFEAFKQTVQTKFESINQSLQAKYLPGSDITNLNGTNETSTNFAWRLDFGQTSLLILNCWINDFNAPDAWKSYKTLVLPQSFLNGATKTQTIPEQKTEDNDAIVNWKLTPEGQLSVDVRSTAVGTGKGIGFVGLFLLTK